MLDWLRNRLASGFQNKVTTTISVVALIDALIQILYSFDSSAETTTDWDTVGVLVLAAVGFFFSRDA